MDMRDLEGDVQRAVGYNVVVTSGIKQKGAHLDFNSGPRMLRVWIPRAQLDLKKLSVVVNQFISDPHEAAFKEIEYESL